MSAPVLFVVPREFESGNRLALIAIIFPIVGVWLLARALRITLKVAKFGTPLLHLSSVPGVLGGELRGMIETRLPAAPENGVVLRITCFRRTVSRSGRDREVREQILWRDERTVPPGEIAAEAGGAAIPVRLDLPADQPATDSDDPDNATLWRLDAGASLPGVDFDAQFDVPVFRTSDSPPAAGPPAARAGPAPRPARLQTIVRTTARGGLELFSPRDRNPGPALGLTAFWVIWSGAVWLQVALKVPLIFPVIFGLFDVILLLLVLGLWFGTSRITCEEDRLTVRNVLLGLGVTRAVALADVTAIETPITMQSGGGSGTPYYGIRFRCRDGRTISANFEIRDKQEVEWLVAQLQRAVGLREPSAR